MSQPVASGLIITPAELQIVSTILRRHVQGQEVWAFGSRVKGTTKPYADLDIVILGDTPLSFAVLAALSDDFTESDLPYKVDVVDWATTLDSFRSRIQAAYIVLQQRAVPNV